MFVLYLRFAVLHPHVISNILNCSFYFIFSRTCRKSCSLMIQHKGVENSFQVHNIEFVRNMCHIKHMEPFLPCTRRRRRTTCVNPIHVHQSLVSKAHSKIEWPFAMVRDVCVATVRDGGRSISHVSPQQTPNNLNKSFQISGDLLVHATVPHGCFFVVLLRRVRTLPTSMMDVGASFACFRWL